MPTIRKILGMDCSKALFLFTYVFHFQIWLPSDSFQAFKHIFTSPSSVEKEPKATRSGNARIHGMRSVTLPSIAYVATQVCEVGSLHQLKYIFWPPSQIGSLQPIFISRIFQDRHHHRFREVLQLRCWTIWWSRRTRGGERTPRVVEPVCLHCIWKCFVDEADNHFSNIFPNQAAKHPACKNSALAKIKEKRAERRALESRGENI